MKLNWKVYAITVVVLASVILFQTCKQATATKKAKYMSLTVQELEESIQSKHVEIHALNTNIDNLQQSLSEKPKTVTNWLPLETKYVKVEDTGKIDYYKSLLDQAIANPNCSQQIKVALNEIKDTLDHYRSTTHYEARDSMAGYDFIFRSWVSRNSVDSFTYKAYPPLIPATFRCPECPHPSTVDEPKVNSLGFVLGQQDIFGDRLNEIGLSHGWKNFDLQLTRGFDKKILEEGTWNISINPKIRYKKRK